MDLTRRDALGGIGAVAVAAGGFAQILPAQAAPRFIEVLANYDVPQTLSSPYEYMNQSKIACVEVMKAFPERFKYIMTGPTDIIRGHLTASQSELVVWPYPIEMLDDLNPYITRIIDEWKHTVEQREAKENENHGEPMVFVPYQPVLFIRCLSSDKREDGVNVTSIQTEVPQDALEVLVSRYGDRAEEKMTKYKWKMVSMVKMRGGFVPKRLWDLPAEV